MRVAIVGVSHWHVLLYYLPALQQLDAEIVAVSDPSPEVLTKVGSGIAASRYRDYGKLLDSEQVDLVMAHAPHDQMTELAAQLVTRHQPFHMEKPMGLDWRRLEPIAAKAETEGIFVSVPLISRYLGLVEKLDEYRQAEKLGQAYHYYYRLLAGGPQRYVEWGCPWMLAPKRAGSGPLFNFGPHAIDTFIYLADQPVARVYAQYGEKFHKTEIEDMVAMTLVGKEGAIGTAEVGYVLPEGYERYLSLTTDTLHASGSGVSGQIQFRDGTQASVTGPDADECYFRYTADMLERLASGQPPRATIHDMVAALRIINAADLSARRGSPVALEGVDE